MASPKVPPLFAWPRSASDRSDAQTVHRLFNELTWKAHPWFSPRLSLLLEIALWPARALGLSIASARKHGPAIAERTGKTVLRQGLEQFWLSLRHSIPPKNYYILLLFRDENRKRAATFIHRFETQNRPRVRPGNGPRMRPGVYRTINVAFGGRPAQLSNKWRFANQCEEAGLPTPRVLLWLSDGEITRPAAPQARLPRQDLFIKPARGAGGLRLERWNYRDDGRYRDAASEQVVDSAELLERLRRLSAESQWLVQEVARNHKDLLDLGDGVLTTARIQTALDESGVPEVVASSFRIPVGSKVVDNLHRGGVACAADLRTGVLGRAIALGGSSDWRDGHPVSGAAIAGRRLPFWDEAVALVCRAHRTLPYAVFVGWDVGFTDEGPILVEANVQADVNILQRSLGGPLGSARYGELMAFHIRNATRGHALS